MSLHSLQEIKRAIGSLPYSEIAEIEAWLLAPGVREPAAAAYNVVPTDRHLSVEEFLKFEEQSTIRHEYVAGEIFAMTGASVPHNMISVNLVSAFHSHLRGRPCKAFINDVKVKVKINDDEMLYYPDVLVSCGKHTHDQKYVMNPTLIIEVLSPSTEMIDRREKALTYRQIPQLEEYVLVAQRIRHVTIFRRGEGWQPQHLSSGEDVAEFRSIELAVPLTQIYEGVPLRAASADL
jgi:Uma2 family endonuclease